MRFSNFLFPESRDQARDGQVLDEVLAEVQLCEALGMEALWLSEHHFDGNCAYVDPVAFAAVIAAATQRIRIGFAVAQMSLHHPIRLAEQLSLIDHVSKGRLIVGLGRGTNYNIYEYQGYGIDHEESQARFEEAAGILMQAWTSENGFSHRGRFWDLKVPVLRPRPYTRPHPFTIRATASEASITALGRQGEPFLMNVQSNDTTRHRIALWRQAAQEAGIGDAAIAAALGESWVWRNVFVAETDAEAERIGLPAFTAMQEHRAAMRNRVLAEQGLIMGHAGAPPPARIDPRHALICGSPATVAEQMQAVAATGAGGVILAFRMGPMSYAQVESSLTLFMEQVAPQLSQPLVAAAAGT
ncbi:LLM class flavin-dependent oxidoreductase [Roseomonas hellenica]|uniref:LLM class flavin-dependent oxidoreductase n=1 Tax=Plastoroseomonas hellenica TaxID=2687306 RepID=A0ABS5F3J2_9PROT|nr:LLM class flavin-dependent oxidoreductase [Plastoroseomonas hellenica]MBR0666705.1 LLM class flavin-dependent oxidoreductase [Plastoroseomonas hellenica]